MMSIAREILTSTPIDRQSTSGFEALGNPAWARTLQSLPDDRAVRVGRLASLLIRRHQTAARIIDASLDSFTPGELSALTYIREITYMEFGPSWRRTKDVMNAIPKVAERALHQGVMSGNYPLGRETAATLVAIESYLRANPLNPG